MEKRDIATLGGRSPTRHCPDSREDSEELRGVYCAKHTCKQQRTVRVTDQTLRSKAWWNVIMKVRAPVFEYLVIGETILEKLGDLSLLEVCYSVGDLGFQNTQDIPSVFLCLSSVPSSLPLPPTCRSRCKLSAVPIAMPFLCHHELWTMKH